MVEEQANKEAGEGEVEPPNTAEVEEQANKEARAEEEEVGPPNPAEVEVGMALYEELPREQELIPPVEFHKSSQSFSVKQSLLATEQLLPAVTTDFSKPTVDFSTANSCLYQIGKDLMRSTIEIIRI